MQRTLPYVIACLPAHGFFGLLWSKGRGDENSFQNIPGSFVCSLQLADCGFRQSGSGAGRPSSKFKCEFNHWKIEEKDLGTTPRSRDFFTDQELETYLTAHNAGHAVTPWDYDGSCFDRGHQAPSADRTDSQQDNDATFMMSNIIPQTPYLNRVIWEHLEVYTRKLVKQGKTVYAIAGPIYDQNFGAIGPQKDIPVPSKNFKILVIQDTASAAAAPQIIAVVMPNTAEDGSVPHPGHCAAFSEEATPNVNDWMKYKASVADIEKMTGLFFQLP